MKQKDAMSTIVWRFINIVASKYEMTGKSVCIIGAGVSGLVAIKACLEEKLQVTCYEQHDKLGGVWYYTEEVRPNQGPSAYATLVTNSSKDMMAFSDYPMPPQYPPYLPWEKFTEYLQNYADHFNLAKHITFNTKVVSVDPVEDKEGRWKVCVSNGDSKSEFETKFFDHVIVCAGFFKNPVIPEIPGLQNFKGKVMHTHSYRSPEVFKDKTVLVIGNANSASDAATDAATYAKKAYVSIGDGTWVLSRSAQQGLPRDFMLRRVLMNFAPQSVVSRILMKDCNTRFNHEAFGLQSTQRPMYGSAVMVNDEISYKIISGKLQVKATVVEFTEHGVKLEDGSTLDGIDMVCFATGFKVDFSFMNEQILKVTNKEINLYKMVWPIEQRVPSIAVVGCFSTVGAHTPIMELQSYWAARVFSGKCKLPPKTDMKKWIDETIETQIKNYGKLKIKLHQLPYRDSIAEEIGALPNIKSLLLRDPAMAMRCFFGPAFPYQYRLTGPLAIDAARDYCINAYDNTVNATKTRIARTKPGSGNVGLILFIFLAIIAVILAILIR
ncbi:unnamed protein product [Owenia fusiformis]|uniref:Flavin-containing monooxygenase n=1 Tax=Owenia fusiformis TaxID=6347 RepID=A0A8J1UKX9_OWEFU|nr:unnamed protein product [Owenia fusiformis]